MGRWIRVDASRQQHPRSLVAGFWGGVVVEAIWEITKEHGSSGGVLPSIYWTSEYIARWTQADKERGGKVGIEKGMKLAMKAGLIDVLENGDIQVHDWFECQRDGTDAERKKRQREAKKNKRLAVECPSTVPDTSGAVRDATGGVQKCHNDRTVQYNTEEKKKKDFFLSSESDICLSAYSNGGNNHKDAKKIANGRGPNAIRWLAVENKPDRSMTDEEKATFRKTFPNIILKKEWNEAVLKHQLLQKSKQRKYFMGYFFSWCRNVNDSAMGMGPRSFNRPEQ